MKEMKGIERRNGWPFVYAVALAQSPRSPYDPPQASHCFLRHFPGYVLTFSFLFCSLLRDCCCLVACLLGGGASAPLEVPRREERGGGHSRDGFGPRWIVLEFVGGRGPEESRSLRDANDDADNDHDHDEQEERRQEEGTEAGRY